MRDDQLDVQFVGAHRSGDRPLIVRRRPGRLWRLWAVIRAALVRGGWL